MNVRVGWPSGPVLLTVNWVPPSDSTVPNAPPAPIAGLPAASARVCVGPPLFWEELVAKMDWFEGLMTLPLTPLTRPELVSPMRVYHALIVPFPAYTSCALVL